MMRLVIAAVILLMHAVPARAALLWNWSYSGNGISASGTFTTSDAPDGAGHFQIIRITGAENGVGITGLQSTGTAIPGNEPYAVDNLVSAVEPHLTKHGFGFSLANGNYANPFFKDSSYYEYLSVPPHVNGAGPEKSVSFSAAIVPEPSAASLMLTGLVGRISFAQIFRVPTNLNRSQLHRVAVPVACRMAGHWRQGDRAGVEAVRSADDGIGYMRLRRRIAPSPRRAVLKRTIDAGSGAGTALPVKSNVICWAMFQSVS